MNLNLNGAFFWIVNFIRFLPLSYFASFCVTALLQCLLVCAFFRHSASQTRRHGTHFSLPGTVGCHRRYAKLISFLFYMQQMSDTFNCIILLVSTSSFAYFGAKRALALKCFCEFPRCWKIEFATVFGVFGCVNKWNVCGRLTHEKWS